MKKVCLPSQMNFPDLLIFLFIKVGLIVHVQDLGRWVNVTVLLVYIIFDTSV